MTRPRPRIGSELLLIGLILGSLVGTWFLIVSMHRRAERRRKPITQPAVIARKAAEPKPALAAPPPPPPEEPPPPPVLVEDPTRPVLARLGAEEAEQRLEAEAADRKAEALERARRTAVDESARWQRQEQIIRGQVDRLASRAQQLEQEADALAMERDVLAHEREAAKAALAKASHRSSFAVLPNRAPNGTWRRPIVIECRNGTATLQPHGPTFSLIDLSGLLTARSSPIVIAVVRELVRIQGLSAPDGTPAVPYIFFLVRPDGIRPYYEARARLESLGIAFGYELVDQEMEIDFPDLDHPDEWDGSAPLPSFPVASLGNEPAPSQGRPGGQGHSADDFRWPSTPAGGVPGSELGEGYGRHGAGGGGLLPADDPGGGPGRDPSAPRGFGQGGRTDRLAEQGRQALDSTPGFGPIGGSLPSRTATSATPGMLPPIAGAGGTPGMLPPSSGSGGFGAGTNASAPGSERSPWSNAGANGAFSATGSGPQGSDRLPPELASIEPRGGSGMGSAPDVPIPPHPDDLSKLDGFSLLRQRAAQAASSRRQGLRPGEPGAPPENGSGPSGAQAQGIASLGSMTANGSGSSGAAGSSGSPGSSGAAGSSSAGGSSMGGNTSGNVGTSTTSAQPGGDKLQGEESLIPRPREPLKIEVPMEIVVACSSTGVKIHPGGYQLTSKTLKGKQETLAKSLRTIVHLRQQVDPMIRPRPSIRFLVEPGGGETYREARRQTVLSGLDWPTVLQVSDTRVLEFLPRERF